MLELELGTMEAEKSFYKINEVCSMTGVKPYVLRFWEAEFTRLSPILSSTGQRLYEFQHIQLIKQIKDLLFVKKLTIEKAKLEIDGDEEQLTVNAGSTALEAEPVLDEDVELTEVLCELEPFSSEKIQDIRDRLGEILTKIETIETTHQWL